MLASRAARSEAEGRVREVEVAIGQAIHVASIRCSPLLISQHTPRGPQPNLELRGRLVLDGVLSSLSPQKRRTNTHGLLSSLLERRPDTHTWSALLCPCSGEAQTHIWNAVLSLFTLERHTHRRAEGSSPSLL